MKTTVLSAHSEFIYPECLVTKSCHASTVLPLSGGNVVAAWFGGTKEGADDVKIYVSVRENGVWSAPYSVSAPEKPLPHWNPVLFSPEEGKIILYFKYGKPISKWVTYYAVSLDGGKSFCEAKPLLKDDNDGGRGPVKNKPVMLKDGTVLAPASKEHKINGWKCFVDISKDGGFTFEHSNFVLRPKKNGKRVDMIQPTLWEDENGVHMFVRTNAGRIYRSDSKTAGKTWCKAYETELLNNNSGIDAVSLSDGSLVLVSNPIGKNWGDRSPLTLMRSFDGGKTFEEFYKLESKIGDFEFSYPAITAVNKKLYITYTYERKTIKYAEIEID